MPWAWGSLASDFYRPTGWAHACSEPHRGGSTPGEACLLHRHNPGEGISLITGSPFCEVSTYMVSHLVRERKRNQTLFWHSAYSGCCCWCLMLGNKNRKSKGTPLCGRQWGDIIPDLNPESRGVGILEIPNPTCCEGHRSPHLHGSG